MMVRSLSWKKASSRPGSPLGAGAGAGGGEGSGGGGSCRGGSLGGFLGGGMWARACISRARRAASSRSLFMSTSLGTATPPSYNRPDSSPEKTPLSLSRGSSRSICKIWMASSTFFWRASPSRGRSARSSRVASSSRLAWLSKGPRRAMRDSAWGFIPARAVEGLSAGGGEACPPPKAPSRAERSGPPEGGRGGLFLLAAQGA